jgi:hypothetical protein
MNLSGTVSSRSCPGFRPEPGARGTITMYNWLTEPLVDIGFTYNTEFTLGSGLGGTTSNGGKVQYNPITGSTRFTFTSPEAPVSRMDDGINFPVVFDICMKVGDQAIAGRMVCQPKPSGMLCH